MHKMSQWAKIRELRLYDAASALYSDSFPIEIRSALAQWLEDYLFSNNTQHCSYASSFMQVLLEQLNLEISKIDESNDRNLFYKKFLIQSSTNIKQKYSTDAASLFKTLQFCLEQEQKLILQAERLNSENAPASPPAQIPVNKNAILQHKFQSLSSIQQVTATSLGNMKTVLERSVIEGHEVQKFNDLICQATGNPNAQTFLNDVTTRKYKHEQNISHYQGYFSQQSNYFNEQIRSLASLSTEMQNEILAEISEWKEEQRLQANGHMVNPIARTLDMIQDWCSMLASSHMAILQQLREVETLRQNMNITDAQQQSFKQSFFTLIKELVQGSFVVETQPPQVIQTKTKITQGVSVRLLVGATLNQYLTPGVSVTLIGESQVYALWHQSHDEAAQSIVPLAPLTNCKGNMKFDGKKRFFAEFANIKMPDKIPRRGNRTPLELVSEEKACLHFSSTFSVAELNIPIWTISLPIGITVHKSQEPQAWGTIIWDNGFAQRGRLPFQVSSKERWEAVEKMLDVKFASKTGKGLTQGNKEFLKQKIFQNNVNDGYVTWSMFYKDELPGTAPKAKDSKDNKGFTFWQWFYAIMELIEAKCQDLWKEGKIEGFISKEDAEKNLAGQCDGTFLIRFSDSKLGGITIAWKHADKRVYSVQPYNAAELDTKSLDDRINDLNHLVYLYPHTLKSVAFSPKQPNLPSRTSAAAPTIRTGYVKPKLVETVPDFGSLNLSSSHLNTLGTMTPPHSLSPHSPLYTHGFSPAHSPGDPPSVESYEDVPSNESLMEMLDNLQVDRNGIWSPQ